MAGTVLAGSIFSFWYYATSPEVNMPAIFFIMLALYFLTVRKENRYSGLLMYSFLCIATLFHQVVILIAVTVFIYDIIRSRYTISPIKHALPPAIAGVVIYLTVALNETAEKSISGIYKWLTHYGHAGEWGKLSASNITQSVWGKIKLLYGGDIIREYFYGGQLDFFSVIIIVLMIIIYIALVYLFIVASWDLYKSGDSQKLLFLALILGMGLFAFWWAPHDDGFWLYAIVFFCLYVFCKPLIRNPSRLIASIAIALLTFMNLACEFIPSSDKDNSHIYQASMAFKRLKLNPDDLVITNLSQARLAYEYYTGIHVPTTCIMFLPPGDKAKIITEYHQRIAETGETARVFMFEDEIHPDNYRDYLFTRFTPGQYEQTYERYFKHLIKADSVYMHGRYVTIYQLKM
jgi:hypothetical protein